MSASHADPPPTARWPGLLSLCTAFLPVAFLLFRGALFSPLWLDEISYHYWEDPALRAEEVGRPAGPFTRTLSNYAFADLQAAVGRGFARAGAPFENAPELILRTLPLASFLGAVFLLHSWLLRRTGSPLRATLGTLAFSGSPFFLPYAFEARGYASACLLVLVLVALSDREETPGPPRLLLLSAFGILLVEMHPWTVLVFGGFLAALAVARVRRVAFRGPELALIAASIPALSLFAVQFAWLRATDPGWPRFPLFHPAGPVTAAIDLLAVPIRTWPGMPAPRLAASYVLRVLMIALPLLAAWRLRRERAGLFAVAGIAALAASVSAHSFYGFVVPGRHQIFLWALAVATLALGASRAVVPLLGLQVAAQLVLLPQAAELLARKSNGPMLAAIHSAHSRRTTPIVFAPPLRMGFPDPILGFPLDFELNVIRPGEPPVRLLELPDLRNVAGTRVISPNYLCGGDAMLRRFLSVPAGLWRRRLPELPDEIWLLEAQPAIPAEARLQEAFDTALREAGFRRAEGRTFLLAGDPPSRLALFVRSASTDPNDSDAPVESRE